MWLLVHPSDSNLLNLFYKIQFTLVMSESVNRSLNRFAKDAESGHVSINLNSV